MIRNKVAEIFDTHIDDRESLKSVFERMEVQGRLDVKKLQELVLLVLEQLESLDKKS